MSQFDATEARIDHTRERFPAFPRSAAVVARLIRHIDAQVNTAANVVLREHALNHTDYNILMMLYGSADNALNPSLLGGAAAEKSANLTRVCNALAERGLVARVADPGGDRRKVVLSLTARGRRLIESLLPQMTALLNAYTRGFRKADLAELESLLKRLLDNAEALV